METKDLKKLFKKKAKQSPKNKEQYIAVSKTGKVIRLIKVPNSTIEANRPSVYQYRF